MKEIKQGSIFGYELVLKVPEDFVRTQTINEFTVEKYIKKGLMDERKRIKEAIEWKVPNCKYKPDIIKILDEIID